MSTTLDILINEYQYRISEMIFHDGNYHKQNTYLYWYFTFFYSFLYFIFREEAMMCHYFDSKLIWTMFLVMSSVIFFFLVSSVMSALFMVYMRGIRIAAIEELINMAVGDNILVWESIIVKKLYSQAFTGYKTWLNPSWMKTATTVLLVLIQTIVEWGLVL